MYNPIQSNFNKIEHSEKLDLDLIDKIFDIVHRVIHFKKPFTNYKPFGGISEIMSILDDSNNIKNVTYGMSIDKKYRYCIPYLKKDSPNEGSKFSSIIYTIVLTILYFYNNKLNKYILEEKDIKLIYTNKKTFNKIKRIYNIDDDDLVLFLIKFNQIKINDAPEIPDFIMKMYFRIVFSSLSKSLAVSNCSFIDIINMDSVWQVGYSGTVSIDFMIEPIIDDIKYNVSVIRDPDENQNVRIALTNNKHVFNIEDRKSVV